MLAEMRQVIEVQRIANLNLTLERVKETSKFKGDSSHFAAPERAGVKDNTLFKVIAGTRSAEWSL